MNIYPTSTLSEPSGSKRIPIGTIGYFRSRNKHRVYSLVIKEFKSSGLSQADLARRLGKKNSDIICRWLAAPGNWTLDTVSDLMFAISGAEVTYGSIHPLAQPPRNYTMPEWLNDWEQPDEIRETGTTSNANVFVVA